MGFFDFLKTKDKSTDQIPKVKADRPECDISKTQFMVELFQIPQEKREDAWRKSFYENVQIASYACGTPQIFNGPDGFPYFVLRTPEAGKPFESFCIRNMMDDFLLEKGFGVALNPKDNGADWVFSYGDILNLYLNNEFFSKTDNVELQNVETIEKEEEVLIAQPSESYFPKQSREILKRFLQSIGVKRPMIMMVCRTINKEVVQELAFNLFAEDFANTDQLNYRLKQISWFLPRHYVILSVPKNSDLANHFNYL
jgi:hypothetical protein